VEPTEKIMRNYLFLAGLLTSFVGAKAQAEFVNPFIGTGSTGHTFPGAVAPFGMVQAGPDTRIDGSWEGCSGYHYSDSIIYGFSHTHLSGTGCSDYGDVMFMPFQGKLPEKITPSAYAAAFSHKNEKAEPGYYSVILDDRQIRCEVTVTERVALHKITPSKGDSLHLIFDLKHRDELLEGFIKQINPYELSGMRRSKAWARDQSVYFHLTAEKPFSVKAVGNKSDVFVLSFAVQPDEPVLFKVALSGTDSDGAQKNREEIARFDFEKTRKETREKWNRELSKIQVAGGGEKEKTNFYTALYHTMIHPSLFSDTDGRYRGRDGEIHRTDGETYTVFSLWDTFRALHPLHHIINRKRSSHFIQSMLNQYREGGRLPMWELWCNETDCMIGYHAVAVLADALTKGIPLDSALALEAAVANANLNNWSIRTYAEKGYLEVGDEPESVAKTLEYAYDDWCIALLAKAVKNTAIKDAFLKRAGSWIHLSDPETGWMRPRVNGGRLSPFDPREVNNHYTEANALQYSFFVPQDIYGLIKTVGGKGRFENLLDQLFSYDSRTTGRTQVDITGLIGQYAHGNEPSHHMAYLYNYTDNPHKTARYIHTILDSLYQPVPKGLPGNEDCGQMSAWYVFSAMGIYPATPGSPYYHISFPIFEHSDVLLENRKIFRITAKGNTKGQYHLVQAVLNGKEIQRTYITHDEIMQGGTLELTYSSEASENVLESAPAYFSPPLPIAAPEIRASQKPFKDSLRIEIIPSGENQQVRYNADGSDPKIKGIMYTAPFFIKEKTRIRALSIHADGGNSAESAAEFRPFPHPERSVTLFSSFNRQYTAGGPDGLIDGIRGDENWRKGHWQGYQNTDFHAELDLGIPQFIRQISVGFLQDFRSWILMPKKVRFTWMDEQRKILGIREINISVDDKSEDVVIKEIAASLHAEQVRYVKIEAENYGLLPAWHPGAGNPAFIFTDEIRAE
jgi:predicted alpha-1,2-mannosidase